ncbi:hypothetical protein KM043_009571 [Ampulex compressa]|nr:hypothetical protein KM043_009571 [Ampulex compressa]
MPASDRNAASENPEEAKWKGEMVMLVKATPCTRGRSNEGRRIGQVYPQVSIHKRSFLRLSCAKPLRGPLYPFV